MDATSKSREAGAEVQRTGCATVRKWLLRTLVYGTVLVLVCAGLGAGFVYAKFGAIRASEPYRMALEQVQKDPQVVQQLGEPVEDITWLPGGLIEKECGTANLHFTVAGPKGRAQVGTQARCINGTWGLVTLDVNLPNGQRKSLDTGDAGPDEAPKWSPGK